MVLEYKPSPRPSPKFGRGGQAMALLIDLLERSYLIPENSFK